MLSCSGQSCPQSRLTVIPTFLNDKLSLFISSNLNNIIIEVLVAVQGLQVAFISCLLRYLQYFCCIQSRVRSLQDENAKLKEVVRQTQRERDNHIAATTEIQKFQTDSLLEEVAALRQENETIHKSQGSLQLEISRQREENARLKARLAALTDDVVMSAL